MAQKADIISIQFRLLGNEILLFSVFYHGISTSYFLPSLSISFVRLHFPVPLSVAIAAKLFRFGFKPFYAAIPERLFILFMCIFFLRISSTKSMSIIISYNVPFESEKCKQHTLALPASPTPIRAPSAAAAADCIKTNNDYNVLCDARSQFRAKFPLAANDNPFFSSIAGEKMDEHSQEWTSLALGNHFKGIFSSLRVSTSIALQERRFCPLRYLHARPRKLTHSRLSIFTDSAQIHALLRLRRLKRRFIALLRQSDKLLWVWINRKSITSFKRHSLREAANALKMMKAI